MSTVADCILKVPDQALPTPADIADGFALSAWIRPVLKPGTAYILAKTSEEEGSVLYSLRIHRRESVGGYTTRLQLVYSTDQSQVRYALN